jgi:hypothetical protein
MFLALMFLESEKVSFVACKFVAGGICRRGNLLLREQRQTED